MDKHDKFCGSLLCDMEGCDKRECCTCEDIQAIRADEREQAVGRVEALESWYDEDDTTDGLVIPWVDQDAVIAVIRGEDWTLSAETTEELTVALRRAFEDGAK